MASPSNDVSAVTEGWTKWQIGIAVGAPIALGLAGIWYYKRYKSKQNPKEVGLDRVSLEQTDKSIKNEELGGGDKSANEKATDAKNKGNKYFKGGRYDLAIECYTEAIKICPQECKKDLATFYQNRAAAYEQLKNYKMVVEDCSQALEFDSRYIKALSRRARACEQLGDLTQSLEDVTGLCILEGFQNPQTLHMADRVLKDLGKMRAQERFKNRKPALPTKHFIRTYFDSFRNDPIWSKAKKLESSSKGNVNGDLGDGEKGKVDSPFIEALHCLLEEKHGDIIRLCSEELQIAETHYRAESLLLRGTFYYLSIQMEQAIQDFESILKMENIDKKIRTSTLIKKGSILLQQEKSTEGLDDFAAAVRIEPDNADIYHHRGHYNLQLERLDDAVKDFDCSIAKCPDFAVSHVQRCFAEHRKAVQLQSALQRDIALKMYEDTVKMFPDCADGHALYAQSLVDYRKFQEADKEFEKALELDPQNVQPMVHRALLHLQWKEDLDAVVKLIKEAIELDSECEYAYEILGTFEVQKGNIDEAVKLFNKAIELSRTESEMAHLYSLLDAAHAQLKVAKKLGISIPNDPGMGKQ